MTYSTPLQRLELIQFVMDGVDFDYRECAVKGRMSHTWKARIPAIYLSLMRIEADSAFELEKLVAPVNFHSSKDTINFFNEHWASHVTISSGKSLISLGNYDDFRDHGVMPLVDNGFAIRNTSVFSKNLNGKDTAYQVTREAVGLIRSYGTLQWAAAVAEFKAARNQRDGTSGSARIRVSPKHDAHFTFHEDNHNVLQQNIIEEMLPRFATHARLVYAADTADRTTFFNTELAQSLDIMPIFSEKKPDIVAYDPIRNWLFIVEAVTSTGHISQGRKDFFVTMLGQRSACAVFVTAFPNRETFRRFAADIAWETEVWLATEPDHMIHFNGERFLGPYG